METCGPFANILSSFDMNLNPNESNLEDRMTKKDLKVNESYYLY